MLNINLGHNNDLLSACKSLQDYATYVKMVRENLAKGMSRRKAVNTAVDEAIRLNLLDGFFKIHKSEVLVNILTEFDQELYDRCRRREGYNEGLEKGMAKGMKKGIAKGIEKGRAEAQAEISASKAEIAAKQSRIAELEARLAKYES